MAVWERAGCNATVLALESNPPHISLRNLILRHLRPVAPGPGAGYMPGTCYMAHGPWPGERTRDPCGGVARGDVRA